MSKWSWKLRLFLSADIVGSTAFKASQSDQEIPTWARTFREFFGDFPDAVTAGYSHLPENCPDVANRLRTWKFSGDEILFQAVLARYQDVVTHLGAFKHAVNAFSDDWSKKEIPLGLKATGWIAGFPVTNREVEVEIEPGRPAAPDFIGPSIDLGFRITKFADKRKFVLSADLALMLLDAVHQLELKRSDFSVFYHGREILKGVIGSQPYPVFWLDLRDGQLTTEEKLLEIQRKYSHDDVIKFLREFLDQTPKLTRPFIEGDEDPRYGNIPKEFGKLLKKIRAEESDRGYLDGDKKERPPEGEATKLDEPKLP